MNVICMYTYIIIIVKERTIINIKNSKVLKYNNNNWLVEDGGDGDGGESQRSGRRRRNKF